ncbi:hypothetical protein RYX36_022823 [Vicia faba]
MGLLELLCLILLEFSNQGIHPSIRGEIWEFLLSYYETKSTIEEREEIRQRRRKEECIFRVKYAEWKEECRELFLIVGSGRFITTHVVPDDGQPIQDLIVLLENNPENRVIIPVPEIGSTNTINAAKKMTNKEVI